MALFDNISINEKKTLFKVHTYTDYRVLTRLEYLNKYRCNAHSKSDHEIPSVDAIVYERLEGTEYSH